MKTTKAELYLGPEDGRWIDAPDDAMQILIPQVLEEPVNFVVGDVEPPLSSIPVANHLYVRVSVGRFIYVGIEK